MENYTKFFLENYLNLLVELIAVVSGLLHYKKYKNSPTKYLIWFLIYILFLDIVMKYPDWINNENLKLFENKILYHTFWMYNFFWSIVNPLFILFYLYKLTDINWLKKCIPYIASLFFVITMTYSFINLNVLSTGILPFVEIIAFLVILFCATTYYVELLKTEKLLLFYESMRFYALTANLIWWFVTTPAVFFDMYYSNLDVVFMALKIKIYFFGNIVMYVMIALGFIVSKHD